MYRIIHQLVCALLTLTIPGSQLLWSCAHYHNCAEFEDEQSRPHIHIGHSHHGHSHNGHSHGHSHPHSHSHHGDHSHCHEHDSLAEAEPHHVSSQKDGQGHNTSNRDRGDAELAEPCQHCQAQPGTAIFIPGPSVAKLDKRRNLDVLTDFADHVRLNLCVSIDWLQRCGSDPIDPACAVPSAVYSYAPTEAGSLNIYLCRYLI